VFTTGQPFETRQRRGSGEKRYYICEDSYVHGWHRREPCHHAG
jgi:hypothetical protein